MSITTKARMRVAIANHVITTIPRSKYPDKNDKISIVLEDSLFKVLYICVQQHGGSS